jgi:hypothetical protein
MNNSNNFSKIHLITSFYFIDKTDEKSLLRNNEITTCLLKNLECYYIKKIHLYVDNDIALDKLYKLCNEENKNKINVVKIGLQPLYSDLFQYAMDNLNDKICMISNSDIYLYKVDNNLLNKLSNNVFALSRHESDFKCHVLGWGSHDAFIFYPNYISRNILNNIKHLQNVAGSDDSIINNLVDCGLKLYNPCFQIMIIHLHNSEVRTYDSKKIAHGKYFIKQEYLNWNNTDILDEYVFYKGLDYVGEDIYFKPNCCLDELRNISNNNPNIIAFNTLGFFKGYIDINKLKSTDWINDKTNHGIYIKKSFSYLSN